MKLKVIEFFQNLPQEKYEQFNQAFELYRKSSEKNTAIERSLNTMGYSESRLENLLYDLQKIHGITDVEKLTVESQICKVQIEEEIESEKWDSLDPEIAELFQTFLAIPLEGIQSWQSENSFLDSDIIDFLEISKNAGINELSDKLQLVIDSMTTPIDTKLPINDVDALVQENENLVSENEDLQFEKEELEDENEALKEEVEALKLAPKLDAKQIRVEFPFLNDPTCPDEMKILMADKITAWNRYLECQEMIAKIESGDVVETELRIADLASNAVKAFDENQKIYDELNAYQNTGKVLGLHPIFKRLQLTREVEEMTPAQLNNYKGSSAKYFSDNRTSLAKAEIAKDTEKMELITNRVAERELKLALVNKKLGISTK